jgi:hypothetical protein
MLETKFKRMVGNNNETFCSTCAPIWDQEIKTRWIAYLTQGGDLTTYFMIPRTTTQYYVNSSGTLIGHLLFTNKAVVFAQFDKVKINNSFTKAVLFGGALGGIVAGFEYSRNIKKAKTGLSEQDQAPGQQETLNMMNEASNLIVLLRNSITDIKKRDGHSLDVRTGAFSNVFTLEGKKNETWKAIEPHVKDFLSAPLPK